MRREIVLSAALILAGGCASMPARTSAPLDRAGMIASTIGEAEQLGAKECAPRALAIAKVRLDHVVHEATEGYYHAAWLEPDIAAAERAAEELLAERKAAASLGTRFRCAAASDQPPDSIDTRPGG